MPKFLVFSDLHLYPFQAFSTLKDGINSRLLETAEVLKEIINIACQEKCDAILFCGDFYHVRKLDIETIEIASRALWEGGCSDKPFIAISGNHDQADKAGEYSSISGLKGRLRVLRTGEVEEIDGVTIKGIPYQGDKKALMNSLKSNESDITLMHTGVSGAAMGSELVAMDHEFVTDGEIGGHSQFIFTGHFHQPHLFLPDSIELPTEETEYVVDEPAIIIPGAPVQHGFGDEGSVRGCWILEWPHKLRFIPLNGPSFIRCTLEEAAKLDPEKKHYATITIKKGTKEKSIKDFEKKSGEAFTGYNFVFEPDIPEVKLRANISLASPESEIIKQYVRRVALEEAMAKELELIGQKIIKEARG